MKCRDCCIAKPAFEHDDVREGVVWCPVLDAVFPTCDNCLDDRARLLALAGQVDSGGLAWNEGRFGEWLSNIPGLRIVNYDGYFNVESKYPIPEKHLAAIAAKLIKLAGEKEVSADGE